MAISLMRAKVASILKVLIFQKIFRARFALESKTVLFLTAFDNRRNKIVGGATLNNMVAKHRTTICPIFSITVLCGLVCFPKLGIENTIAGF